MKYMYFYSYEVYEAENVNNVIGKGYGNYITDIKITNNSILEDFVERLEKKFVEDDILYKGKCINLITLSYLGEATDEE